MFKLVANQEFVRAVKRVMEELQAAGLKMNSDVRSPSRFVLTAKRLFLYFSFYLRTRCRRLWV